MSRADSHRNDLTNAIFQYFHCCPIFELHHSQPGSVFYSDGRFPEGSSKIMDSQDVDSGSLLAVKSLRSKFEQLAVDTSSHVRRSSTNTSDPNASDPSSPRPRRSSGSTVDLFVPQAHVRTSSSSSDLKVSTKRPPPPPPARISRPSLSPHNSRSPSPNICEESEGEEVLRGVSALKNKL